jgi:LmbE family N-acetylglucosaminyl deacetylase
MRTAAGERVAAVFLTSGELGLEELNPDEARAVREAEAEEAARILGIANVTFFRHPDWFLADARASGAARLRQLVEQESPTRILSPHADEWHPDHVVAGAIVRDAVRPIADELSLETYEVWTPMTHFDDVVDISSVIETKLAAVRAYRSQLLKFRYDQAVEGLDRFRGALAAHCPYAEVFGKLDLAGDNSQTPS